MPSWTDFFFIFTNVKTLWSLPFSCTCSTQPNPRKYNFASYYRENSTTSPIDIFWKPVESYVPSCSSVHYFCQLYQFNFIQMDFRIPIMILIVKYYMLLENEFLTNSKNDTSRIQGGSIFKMTPLWKIDVTLPSADGVSCLSSVESGCHGSNRTSQQVKNYNYFQERFFKIQKIEQFWGFFGVATLEIS